MLLAEADLRDKAGRSFEAAVLDDAAARLIKTAGSYKSYSKEIQLSLFRELLRDILSSHSEEELSGILQELHVIYGSEVAAATHNLSKPDLPRDTSDTEAFRSEMPDPFGHMR